jgi:hypothetical protein
VLSAINVGVINEQGTLEATISFEEFLRFAKSQHIYFHTNAPHGELDFDLTISNADNVIDKAQSGESNSRVKSR